MDLLKIASPELWEKAGKTFKETLEAVNEPTVKEITEALQAAYDTIDEFSNLPEWIDSVAKFNVLPLVANLLEAGIKNWTGKDKDNG